MESIPNMGKEQERFFDQELRVKSIEIESLKLKIAQLNKINADTETEVKNMIEKFQA
jgi:hypothetical protein